MSGWKDEWLEWTEEFNLKKKCCFNLWIRPGLVVFTLICVFIDLVSTLIYCPSLPHSLFYAPKTFLTLKLLLSQSPSVIHQVFANTKPSFLLFLSLCSHQSLVGCYIPLLPDICFCLCSQSPYKRNGDPLRHPETSWGKKTHRRERECMFPKLSHDW